MNAVVMHAAGGPDVLRVEQVAEPLPTDGESLVDVTFAGLNFDDLDQRADPGRVVPAVLGVDAVGIRRRDGRRVAALLRTGGGYAQVAAAPDAHTIEVPDDIDDQQALALFEQGATAYGALVLAGRLRPGETVAVSAAAGGVGHLAVQLAFALGAGSVIGITGTAAKQAFVTKQGAQALVDETGTDLGARLHELTGGRGVDVFLDSVGGAQAQSALSGLAPFGRLVTLGWRPGGHVDVPLQRLIEQSVGCAGFWMRHVVDNRELLCHIAQTLFDFARRGQLVAHIDRVVGLRDVAAAHVALAARATVGKVLIDVNQEP
ncbi:MAG TPA: zinc-binding dehydrogenase [Actinocrinis sp.]|uniref:quinone oxidoreductase family protein n=1 Tax=Actinocrinis sp. TaxID=1920516 RepID=UPI002DEEAA98|nr:zinc-binding dehydrogenase [Actinocrinis sp.]